MGMYDYLICEYPIDAPASIAEWQTKDTPEQYLETYRIAPDGRLFYLERVCRAVPDETAPLGQRMETTSEQWIEQTGFRGEIVFYGHEVIDGKDDYERWWEYSAFFDDGKLINIKRIEP